MWEPGPIQSDGIRQAKSGVRLSDATIRSHLRGVKRSGALFWLYWLL